MSVLQHFQYFQRIYFFFGIAPSYIHVTGRTRENSFLIIPVLISFVSTICVALLQFIKFYLDSFGLIMKIINFAFFTSLFLSNIAANFQCFFYKSVYQDNFNRIKRLENICNSKFSRQISTKCTKCTYIIKVIFIVGFWVVSALIVLGQAWYLSKSISATFLAFLTLLKELMTVLGVLHFILYVDFVRMFIGELNHQIRRSSICFYASSKIAFLKDIKLMHMEIFLLMKQINHFFGWHLLLLMIHYFILTTYSFYWIFFTLQSNGKSVSIAEATLTLVYCVISVLILVDSCECCSMEMMNLMESIEKYDFYSSDNIQLHAAKNEVLEQIKNCPLIVTAKGYFTCNRKLLAGIANCCCTYLIIFIQFFLSSKSETHDEDKIGNCVKESH